jgi:hypothetical protein
VAYGHGRLDLAVRDLEAAMPQSGWLLFLPEIHADALVAAGSLHDAARVIEARAPRDRVGLQPFFTVMWLMMRARLADVCRRLGRDREAAAVDAHLRRALVCEDPEFRPLGAHVRSRLEPPDPARAWSSSKTT